MDSGLTSLPTTTFTPPAVTALLEERNSVCYPTPVLLRLDFVILFTWFTPCHHYLLTYIPCQPFPFPFTDRPLVDALVPTAFASQVSAVPEERFPFCLLCGVHYYLACGPLLPPFLLTTRQLFVYFRYRSFTYNPQISWSRVDFFVPTAVLLLPIRFTSCTSLYSFSFHYLFSSLIVSQHTFSPTTCLFGMRLYTTLLDPL